MKKPLVYFLFAALALTAVTGCQKKENSANFESKEEAMARLLHKEVIPYDGGEKIVFKTFNNKELKTVYSHEPYSFTDEMPMKKADAKYHYDFAGWDVSFDFDAKETIAKAKYDRILNEYEVRFVASSGEVISSQMVKYGSMPEVPNGFEARETIVPVWANHSYIQKDKGTRVSSESDFVFEQLPGNEFAIENYTGSHEEHIVIPASHHGLPVTTIYADAFRANGSDIKTIYIPNSINDIYPNAFRGIESLASFELQEGNTTYNLDSVGALYYFYEWSQGQYEKTLLYVPSGKLDLLEIPNDYESVEEGALSNTNATILKMSSIGFWQGFEYVFGGLDVKNSVKQIILTAGYIHDGQFKDLSELYSVTINEAPEDYDDPSYEGPSYSDTITAQAFMGCTNLRGVSLPSRIGSINDEAFKDCVSLEDVILGFGTLSVESFGKHVFDNCPKLKGYEKDGIVYLGNETYKYQIPVRVTKDLVEELTLPAETLVIPDGFFEKNQILRDVNFESATRLRYIGEKAFYACSNLDLFSTKHFLPASLEEVGYKAFTSTKYDTNVSAWLHLRVNTSEYKYCLVNLLKNCGEWDMTFYCKFADPYGLRSGFTTVKASNNNNNFDIYNNKFLVRGTSLLHVYRDATSIVDVGANGFGYNVPYLGTIEPYCCCEVNSLTDIVFLNSDYTRYNRSVHYIGDFAFYNCKLNSKLFFQDDMEYVGESAFYGGINSSVTLNIGTKLAYVGANAFVGGYYGFTLKFVGSQIPATWDNNFDGYNGANTTNTYRFNQ